VKVKKGSLTTIQIIMEIIPILFHVIKMFTSPPGEANSRKP